MAKPAALDEPEPAEATDQAERGPKAAVGFFFAPFAAGLVGAFLAALSSEGPFSVSNIVGMTGTGFIFGTILGYAGVVVVGIPMYFLLRFWRITSLWSHALAFTILGALSSAALTSPSSTLEQFAFPALMGIPGCAVGVLFWLIARPDKFVRPRRRG